MGRGPRRGHSHRSRSTQGGSRFYGQLSEISDWIGLILPVVMKQSAIFKNEILKLNCSVLVYSQLHVTSSAQGVIYATNEKKSSIVLKSEIMVLRLFP